MHDTMTPPCASYQAAEFPISPHDCPSGSGFMPYSRGASLRRLRTRPSWGPLQVFACSSIRSCREACVGQLGRRRPLPPVADLPEMGVSEPVGELEAVAEEAIDGDVERPRQSDECRPACVADPRESQ